MKKLIATVSTILMFGLFNPVLPCKAGGEGSNSCSYIATTTFLGIAIYTEDHNTSCPDEDKYACCTENGAGCEYSEPTITQGEDDGWF
ncbi:hypothetical protein [Fodinibius halophilus]|uniref:Uncharacterized protein n=1 Tax=Fodinibius halophilus TaxID=1736908 RepID=A0A6M1T8E8_9BACT|nr:hypothetical protein [Fodinibius halophilus]NGP87384.1 hypothetical protein [Fodinibius halophilus]